MNDITKEESVKEGTGNVLTASPKPAERKEYTLKKAIIQFGSEISPPGKVILTDGQAERLKAFGAI